MKKQLLFVGAALATFACLTACGDETTINVTETTGMSVVKKGDKTPDCTADNEGEMIYVADSAAAFYCADGKWQTLKGEKGEQGKQGEPGEAGVGEQGPQGPKGDDGVGKQGDPGAAGKSCTAQKLTSEKGYKIVCGGDSVGVVLDGAPGVGTNGTSCSASQETDGVRITCTDNTSFLLPNGNDGSSCSATQVTGGVQIECTDGASFTLNDGANGADGKSFVDGWMVDSRDKQLYRTVTIGEQIWMAENLNYAYTAPTEGNGLDSSSFCFNNAPDSCAKYGRLYLWSAAMDSAGVIPGNTANGCGYGFICPESRCMQGVCPVVQGVCPVGWHIPSNYEWLTLYETVGGIDVAGKVLKAKNGWYDDNGDPKGNGTDDYEFSALPGGLRGYSGSYQKVGSQVAFWQGAGSPPADKAHIVGFAPMDKVTELLTDKRNAASVRCIKDSE